MRDVAVRPTDATDAYTFDGVMREIYREESHVTLDEGIYKTAGLPEWNRPRADRGFVLNGILEGPPTAEIQLDPSAIRDEDITDEPQRIITGRAVWDRFPFRVDGSPLTAEDVWGLMPRGQAVRGGLRLRGNHSLLVDRWKAAGKPLRTSGILLHGHNAAIENVTLLDFGAYRLAPTDPSAESFPAAIYGATAAADRDAIAQLDPETHRYDTTGEPSHITGCMFGEFHPESSNDQVSVFMGMGSIGEPGGWGTGDWRFHWRQNFYSRGNVIEVPASSNHVQGFTIYLAEQGRIYRNRTVNAEIGQYGDYLQTRRLTTDENEFYGGVHGVQLRLSRTPAVLADRFFHEDYAIGLNKITSRGAQVSLDVSGAPTATRYIRVSVDRSLAVENVNLWAQVTRTGKDLNARRGCNPFRR